MQNNYDIIIVGAGPAGCTSAIKLSESNLRVALIDKAVFPRDKICGDALSGKVISVLKYTDLPAEKALHKFPEKLPSWGIRFVAPNGQHLDVPFKKDSPSGPGTAPGYISKRIDFDNFLLDEVKKRNGVDIFEGQKIDSISRDQANGTFLIQSNKESWNSQMIIGADGAHSVVKRFLSPQKYPSKNQAAGLRQYFRGVDGFANEQYIELHFLKDLLPGYFWLFPLPNGWVNAGLGLRSDMVSKRKVNLKVLFNEIMETHPEISKRFKHAEPMESIKGFGLPLGSTWRETFGDGFLLTGDAAGLIDPFSGEGIGNAMISGKIAAEQCLEAFEKRAFDKGSLAPYESKLRKKIQKELAVSTQMQQLANYSWLFNFAVNKANNNPALQSMMSMMFDDIDIRNELNKPSFYWKLLFGT
ncbi:MAG: geranylgeranyl reductase family protein [Bacteroidia bacterium]|nr:geranylgeranyl reductase family protein [Bacteroidia bacterium]